MRKLVILTRLDDSSLPNGVPYLAAQTADHLPPHIPFSNAKTLLGQEFPCAVYDMRTAQGVCLNLEALAIVAGTIQRGGTLYLLCPAWHELEQQIDNDSRRWHAEEPIATPLFYLYFKGLIDAFGFAIETSGRISQNFCNAPATPIEHLTPEQQIIFDSLPHHSAHLHFITAPRGRGKSTLAGKLANRLSHTHSVLITARSHTALPNFWRQLNQERLTFFAPDKLLQLIAAQQISPQQWLFIDEAASLPLPQLRRFCDYFDKVVLTSTTHNYEGTGRGFPQKLLPQLQRPTYHWTLNQSLRWDQNDPLETFIHQLLLLEPPDTSGRFGAEICNKLAFYQLLADAHYKTTPTDLRRLFDAPDQQFYAISDAEKTVAAAWAMAEGNLDDDLTQAIWRGERRPHGNLVAQYLCFQGNLPTACRLRSLRLSRLAVQPAQQRRGYGKRLVSQIISQIDPLVDFISVSFGLNEGLLHFWQQCGFQLVQITPTVEASSGCHSAMMLLPLSEQGKQFTQQATAQFERDFPLLPFSAALQQLALNRPLAEPQPLTEADWQNLAGFAFAQRTFSACYAALCRLAAHFPAAQRLLSPYLERRQYQLHKAEQTALRHRLGDFLLSINVKKI